VPVLLSPCHEGEKLHEKERNEDEEVDAKEEDRKSVV
jgi:hypothetical protein